MGIRKSSTIFSTLVDVPCMWEPRGRATYRPTGCWSSLDQQCCCCSAGGGARSQTRVRRLAGTSTSAGFPKLVGYHAKHTVKCGCRYVSTNTGSIQLSLGALADRWETHKQPRRAEHRCRSPVLACARCPRRRSPRISSAPTQLRPAPAVPRGSSA